MNTAAKKLQVPSMPPSKLNKLALAWKGPYVIAEVVGRRAYKIAKLDGMAILNAWNALH